jgi:hypothetical protein
VVLSNRCLIRLGTGKSARECISASWLGVIVYIAKCHGLNPSI